MEHLKDYDYSILNDHLSAEALEEFKASGIDEVTAAHNFRSFDGSDETERDEAFLLLIPEPDHNNNGTLAGKAQNELANALYGGGWFFEGHGGVSVKLNNPRNNAEDKVIKYESPRGAGNQQLFVSHVSVRSAKDIAANLGVKRPELEEFNDQDVDTGFWDWFLTTKLPLLITEGAKKAVSITSNGYAAIALNGIWGWGSNDRDVYGNIECDTKGFKVKSFLPALIPFLNGREIVLAFDRDENSDTIKKVDKAKNDFKWKLAKEIKGTIVAEVVWDGFKGIDDFLAVKGEAGLLRAYQDRKTILKPKATKASESKTPSDSNKEETTKLFTSSIECGLAEVSYEKKDGEPKHNPIGNHLEAIACIDNPDGDGSALLLEFKTFKGLIRRWTMPREYLAGDGNLLISELYKRQYSFTRDKKALLLDYLSIQGGSIKQEYTITDSSGWVDQSFVLPHKTYGDENLKFRNVDPSPEAITELKGTLQGWKDNVAARCAGNSRLILGLGTSFAAPLLPIIDIESGGFHLVGETSQGKTTILSVAASVTGVKDIPHWRTTTNGLESIATAFNHLCLPLDEIGQADPRDVGNIAYMLANGQGKARMTKNLTNRKPKTWKLMVLSSGEVGLGAYMAQANITQKGGQEVRLPDVPAIPQNSAYGCFETIHEADTAVQFVSALEAAVSENHGTALDAFLSQLVVDITNPMLAGNLSKQVHLIAAKLSEGNKDSAIGRVAKRFALVQVSLGLAHKYGLLPFDIEQVSWAVSECFNGWLKARGGDGSIEIKQAIKRIEYLFATNEIGDRVDDLRNGTDSKARNLLAHRKCDTDGDTTEFWVPPSVFKKEMCEGVNEAELIKELQKMGWLLTSTDDRPTVERQKDKKKARYFVFVSWRS